MNTVTMYHAIHPFVRPSIQALPSMYLCCDAVSCYVAALVRVASAWHLCSPQPLPELTGC